MKHQRIISLLLCCSLLLCAASCTAGDMGDTQDDSDGTSAGSVGTTEEQKDDTDRMKVSMYVKPGADNAAADGSRENPYGTVNAAFDAAEKLIREAETKKKPCDVEITLADGVHKLTGTAALSSKSIHGMQYSSLAVRAEEDAAPVVDGSVSLDTAKFRKVEGKDYYEYSFEKNSAGEYPVFRDLYVNGVRAELAVSDTFTLPSSFDSPSVPENENNYKGVYIGKELADRLPDGDLGEMELYVGSEWEFYILRADSVTREDTKTIGEKDCVRLKLRKSDTEAWLKYHHQLLDIRNRDAHLANHPCFIDEPGEYAYDTGTGKLWYYPAEEITGSDIAYSSTETLFKFTQVSNAVIEGITFTGTSCTQIPKNGYIAQQANGEARKGLLKTAAICSTDSGSIAVRNCAFRSLGTNGLMFRGRTNTLEIRDCRFTDIAMSAITVGEHEWNWGKTNETTDITIENNYAEDIGFDYPASVAFYVGMVKGCKILHNTIRNTAYTGINVGWGWGEATFKYGESFRVNDAEVAYNRIENFMQAMRDGGAIYILGSSCEPEYTEFFNFLHDNYCMIENGNDGQRGYYLDEATANWHLYDNVSIGVHLSMALQHVAGTFVRNILSERFYSDTYDSANESKSRNVVVRDVYLAAADELFDRYPEAKKIYEASGCSLEI